MDFEQKRKIGLGTTAPHSTDADRLVSAGRVDDDDAVELKLRPKRLAEFIGQTKAKEQLAIALEAAVAIDILEEALMQVEKEHEQATALAGATA